MKYIVLAVTLAISALIIAVVFVLLQYFQGRNAQSTGRSTEDLKWFFTPEYKRAGILGEKQAQNILNKVLREDDHCFSNLCIECEGKTAELDLVVVNRYGVFIIEVKNYTGQLIGNQDDFEWVKYKTTAAGNTYPKHVRNPIKQVRRQIYVLSRYLDFYGANTWIRGYVILLHGNSPVDSPYVLNSIEEIERAIHTADRKILNPKTIDRIVSLLN